MGFRGYLHRCRVHAWGCDGPHGVDSGRVESGVGGIRCDARRARASQHRLSSAPSPPCALFSPTALSGAVCSAHVDRPFCSDAVRAMNLTAGERGITFSASVAQLKQAKKQVCVD